MLAAVKGILNQCTDLGRSQVGDLLPPLFGNIEKVVSFIKQHVDSEGLRNDSEKNGARATAAAREIESIARSLPLASLQVADMPFAFCAEKGMQVPADYVLSWYEEDVEIRRKEFFRIAKEIDPNRDAYDLLNNGSSRYSTADEVRADMRKVLGHLRQEALRFIDLARRRLLRRETYRHVADGLPDLHVHGRDSLHEPRKRTCFHKGND